MPFAAGMASNSHERNAARRRVVRITQATAVAAALTTGGVAVIAATTTAHPAIVAAHSSVATLFAASSAPTPSTEAPVATSGGS
jgi:hypothetical protein